MLKNTSKLLLSFMILLQSGTAMAALNPADVTKVAGLGEAGYQDGKSLEAKFNFPVSVVTGKDGEVYLSDYNNHRIRIITPSGEVKTLAGATTVGTDSYGQPIGGYQDGLAHAAMFNGPRGLAMDDKDFIFVADSGNGAVRVIEPSGLVKTMAKGLHSPSDIAISPKGELFVSDTLNHQIVKVDSSGRLTPFAGGGYQEEQGWKVGGYKDGRGLLAQFNEPTGLAFAKNGVLYVADSGNQRIRAISPDGVVTTIAGSGDAVLEETSYKKGDFQDGPALEAKFNFPQGITVSADQTIYVADTYNHLIRKITAGNQVETVAGSMEPGNQNGVELSAKFDGPLDVALDQSGNLLVADQWNNAIRFIDWVELPSMDPNNHQIKVILNNQLVSFDVQPKIVSERTVLPIRQLSELLAYQVQWDGVNQLVTLTKGNRSVQLKIGSKTITGTVNKEMDIAPFIEADRTMVPLRFVSEALGLNVTWLADHRAVLIRE